ncbi:MAG: hypothetical protein WKG07_11695 [Hymenobacter sp.]
MAKELRPGPGAVRPGDSGQRGRQGLRLLPEGRDAGPAGPPRRGQQTRWPRLLQTQPQPRATPKQAVFQQAQLAFQAGDYQPAVDGLLAAHRQPAQQPACVPQALQKRGVAYANLQQQDKAVADFQQSADQTTRAARPPQQALYSLQESLAAAGPQPRNLTQRLAVVSRPQNPDSKATGERRV